MHSNPPPRFVSSITHLNYHLTDTRAADANSKHTPLLSDSSNAENTSTQERSPNHALSASSNTGRAFIEDVENSSTTSYSLALTPRNTDDYVIDIHEHQRPENTAEFHALNSVMRNKKCTLQELQKSASTVLKGSFIASKSEGLNLTSLNDHVGVLHLSCKHGNVMIGETLAVVKDKVKMEDNSYQEAYFIKGYGNRLISLSDLEKIQQDLNAGKKPEEKNVMETDFRGFLKQKSQESTLFARRSKLESATPVMAVPPNAAAMPLRLNWANAENYIGNSFGEKQPCLTSGKESPYHLGYTDYNAIENRMMIFMTSPKMHETEHPMQTRADKTVPASVNIEGAVLAEIQGISHIEVMGPAGQEVGVKLGRLKSLKSPQEGNKILRITTEDGAIHQLEYTPKGLKMKLLQPMASKSEIMAPNEEADISVYGYQGRNSGLHGNVNGYANPELRLSTRECLLAGPLHSNRSGIEGHARQLGTLMAHGVTLTPTLGASTNSVNAAINTTLRAACVAAVVYGLNSAMEAARDPETHTFFGGNRTFSSSGAGNVTSGHLAYVIGLIVIAQTACTAVLNFAYDNLLKDTWKSKETTKGQFLNEALMPFAGEFVRLLINYGLQSSLGLPRGNAYDVASLTGTAIVNTAVNFARGRSGNPENHPGQEVIYKTVEFSMGDLLFRSLGAVAGDPERTGSLKGIDYAEALVTRLGTRGLDKLVLPIMLTVMGSAGLIGPNAEAYDEQITMENRRNGALAYLRGRVSDLNRFLSKKMETLDDHVKNNIEILAGIFHHTAVMIEGTNKYINRSGIKFIQAEENELVATEKAADFANMTDDDKKNYCAELTSRFETMTMTSELSVANHTSQLPESMEEGIKTLMNNFREDYEKGGEANYPSRPSPDFLGGTLPYNATPSTVLGQKTARIQQELTTFSAAPAPHIGDVHNAMASAKGMPEKTEDSREHYQTLTPKILRGIRDSVVKYTKESGPFHYLLRWNNTGQDHQIEIVPGIHLRMAMMNNRNNTSGSPELQISGMDPLLINLGALHAEPFPAIVQRAVVTDALYLPDQTEKKRGVVTNNDRISLTEILSATSAETLAAAFLAALGYGAATNVRNQRIVIKQDTSINIAQYTELMQAESISMPGAIYSVRKIDPEPAAPKNAEGENIEGENLGQVVYMERLNTYQAEQNYRAYRRVMADDDPTEKDKEIFNNLKDGALCIHPETGHFYRYDKESQAMKFEVASKNYFLGTEIETNEKQPARWRFPFTAPAGPAEIRRTIRASILMGDAMAPLMNDAVRNIHHETDRRAGGYYDKDDNGVYISRDKVEDDKHLATIIDAAKPAQEEITRLMMSTPLDGEIEKGKPFPGELLARLFSTALAKPLMFLEIDRDGEIKMAQDENHQNKPIQLAHLTQTHDHLDMQWDEAGSTMLGVGVDGYYAITHEEGKLKTSLINVSDTGLTAGNLLHAIAVSGYHRENQHRYVSENGVIKSATAQTDSRIPGLRGKDKVNLEMAQLLEKLKKFAISDYTPIQQWLGDSYKELRQSNEVPTEMVQSPQRAPKSPHVEVEETKEPSESETIQSPRLPSELFYSDEEETKESDTRRSETESAPFESQNQVESLPSRPPTLSTPNRDRSRNAYIEQYVNTVQQNNNQTASSTPFNTNVQSGTVERAKGELKKNGLHDTSTQNEDSPI